MALKNQALRRLVIITYNYTMIQGESDTIVKGLLSETFPTTCGMTSHGCHIARSGNVAYLDGMAATHRYQRL